MNADQIHTAPQDLVLGLAHHFMREGEGEEQRDTVIQMKYVISNAFYNKQKQCQENATQKTSKRVGNLKESEMDQVKD